MGRKVRSYEYKKFRKEVFAFLEDNVKADVRLEGNLAFNMEVGLSNPLFDASNSIKGVEDVLAEFFQFNDKQVVSLHVDKYLVNKGEEYMKISLRSIKRNIDRRSKYVKGCKG
jgi:Holliday junction resolvase RusA-like endonuclease